MTRHLYSSISLLVADHLYSWIFLLPAVHHPDSQTFLAAVDHSHDFSIVPLVVERHHDSLTAHESQSPFCVYRRDFATAHAVLVLDHGRVVEPEDPEAVAWATAMELDETEWCTDSQRVREEPNRKRKMSEQQRCHRDVLQEVPGPLAQSRP